MGRDGKEWEVMGKAWESWEKWGKGVDKCECFDITYLK